MIFVPRWSSLELLDFTFLSSWSPFAAFNCAEETHPVKSSDVKPQSRSSRQEEVCHDPGQDECRRHISGVSRATEGRSKTFFFDDKHH